MIALRVIPILKSTLIFLCVIFSIPGVGKAQLIQGYLPDYASLYFNIVQYPKLTDVIYQATDIGYGIYIDTHGHLVTDKNKMKPFDDLYARCVKEKVGLHLAILEMSDKSSGGNQTIFFPQIIESAVRRTTFAKSVAAFCVKYSLKGFDFDWEVPAPGEAENFKLLLAELRAELDKQKKAGQERVKITVAVGRRKDIGIDLRHLPFIDYLRIMAYDGALTNAGPNHGSKSFMEYVMTTWTDAGFPYSKMIVGVPFYGRNVLRTEKGVQSFSVILASGSNATQKDKIYNSDLWQVGLDALYYNGKPTLDDKADEILKKGCAGMFVWELTQDAAEKKYSLLNVLYDKLRSYSCYDNFEPNDASYNGADLLNGATLGTSSVTKTIKQYITHSSDQDWYKIQTSAVGTIEFSLSGLPANYNMELYPSSGLNGGSLKEGVNPGVASETINYSVASSSGTTYYLKIYAADNKQFSVCSPYTLTLNWTPKSSSSPVGCTIPTTVPVPSFGNATCPGTSTTTAATLTWNNTNAVNYEVNISKFPYGSLNLLPVICAGSTTSVKPIGLTAGMLYRWNMNASGSTNCSDCEGQTSETKYFHIPPVITSSAQQVCAAQPVTLSTTAQNPGSGATVNYKWFKDGVLHQQGSTATSVQATTAGSYTLLIEYSGNSACNTTASTSASNAIVLTACGGGGGGGTQTCNAPLVPAKNLNITVNGSNSLTLDLERGSGDKRVIKISSNGSFAQPGDGSDPTANTSYGSGEQVVYNGTGNKVTITGLSANTSYCFAVFEGAACSGGTKYAAYATGTACATTSAATTGGCAVPATPVISSSTGQFGMCEGGSVLLNASATGCNNCTYSWNNGQANGTDFAVSDLRATTTFTVTAANNCGQSSASQTITVTPIPKAPASVSSASTSICQNGSVLLTVSGDLSAGASWRWYSGACGDNAEGTGTTLNAKPNTATTYYVRGENGSCYSSCKSTNISINGQTVSLSISPSFTTVCAGQKVTFTASAVNAGTSPQYQWYQDGIMVQTSSNPVYVTDALTGSVQVQCGMNYTNACATQTLSMFSNYSDITVITSGSKPLIYGPLSGYGVCQGSSIELGAFLPGCNDCSFTWSNGAKSESVIVSPASNTTYTVTALSQNGCISGTSSSQLVTVIPLPRDPTTVTATNATICYGGSTNISVAGTLRTGESFAWMQGECDEMPFSGAGSITVNPLTNTTYYVRNQIGACVSNCKSVTIFINQSTQPSLTIVSSALTACEGSSVVFTAAAVNAGTSPVYEWYVNGSPQFNSSRTFNSGQLYGDVEVYCVVRVTNGCVNGAEVSSNKIIVAVARASYPRIDISPSFGYFCAGQKVDFTATTSSAGSAPVYEWFVNNVKQTAGGSMFSIAALNNDAQVHCVLKSSDGCAVVHTVTSNIAQVYKRSLAAPLVSISAATCSNNGDAHIDVSNSVNGGWIPNYRWQVSTNGGTSWTDHSSQGSAFINLSRPAAGTRVRAIMPADQMDCLTKQYDTSNVTIVNCAVTAINNIASLDKISVRPNPSTGLFAVVLGLNSPQKVNFKVYDMTGRIVYKLIGKLMSGSATQVIDLTNVTAGHYQLELEIGKGKVVRGLVVGR